MKKMKPGQRWWKSTTNPGPADRAGRWGARICHDVMEVIMPDFCRICGEAVPFELDHPGVCGRCLAEVARIAERGCRRCGVVSRSARSAGHLCGRCLVTPPAFQRAVSLCSYEGPVRFLLQQLKYRSDTGVLPALASIRNHAERRATVEFDLVLPVPLHKSRLRERGFNQALHLARVMFPELRERIEPGLLVRHRKTVPQAGLDRTQRLRNLQGAFSVTKPEQLENKSVCLVDDVFTTGATAGACARELVQSGAARVEVKTMAGVVLK